MRQSTNYASARRKARSRTASGARTVNRNQRIQNAAEETREPKDEPPWWDVVRYGVVGSKTERENYSRYLEASYVQHLRHHRSPVKDGAKTSNASKSRKAVGKQDRSKLHVVYRSQNFIKKPILWPTRLGFASSRQTLRGHGGAKGRS